MDRPLPAAPLAERLRPTSLDDVIGQSHLLAPGKPLRVALERRTLGSLLLWGPPGVGKTTLARLFAEHLGAHYVGLSAVSAGVKDVRQVAQEAAARKAHESATTLLFLDEVHRFNKAQQDLLLPYVEDGTLLFAGATTENPSFEVIGALRSRCRLYLLNPLSFEEVKAVVRRALAHHEGYGGELALSDEALELLANWAKGDARRALNSLELASAYAANGRLEVEPLREALASREAAFDKGGEHFYNLISALHKSIRGCDPDAALYWLARMLAGGADPLYVARRLVRMASEDVGLADPNALRLALSAKDAVDFLGQPEGELALAEAAVYLAVAPKSNALYRAWGAAQSDVEEHPEALVPLHLRNAPTRMMKSLGYGKAYAYYFDDPAASFKQSYFPDEIGRKAYYDAGGEGWEGKVRERLAAFMKLRSS